ncbi:MAG: SDR family NAD(P)-dependent oxidoreductase, partial [Actinocrinis sp.]
MASSTDRLLTPFDAKSTAAEVVAGVDLAGRTAIVTGGASGIGVETARTLAGAGADVTIAVRNLDAGHATAEDIAATTGKQIRVASLDLIDPASVKAFTAAWQGPLHILVNNAGVMASPLSRTPQGWESQFATNHLGHFLLATGLHPALAEAEGARVVSVSSSAHRRAGVTFEDIHFERREYEPWLAYGQSKTANVLFAVELDRRWAHDGIHGYAVHPGIIHGTNLGPHIAEGEARTDSLSNDQRRAMGLIDDAGQPIIDPDRELKTPQQGASTSVFAATSPLLAEIGGVYLKDND